MFPHLGTKSKVIAWPVRDLHGLWGMTWECSHPNSPSPSLSSSIRPITCSSSGASHMVPATGLWTCSSHFLDCFSPGCSESSLLSCLFSSYLMKKVLPDPLSKVATMAPATGPLWLSPLELLLMHQKVRGPILWSGHMPGLQVGSLVGSGMGGNPWMFLSLSSHFSL